MHAAGAAATRVPVTGSASEMLLPWWGGIAFLICPQTSNLCIEQTLNSEPAALQTHERYISVTKIVLPPPLDIHILLWLEFPLLW